MTTRFYLRSTTETVPISPTPDAAWEDTSILGRARARLTTTNDALATVSFADNDSTDKDVLFRQYISQPLVAGQTITGSQSIKAQCRVSERASTCNMFFTVGIRVIAANGTTVQKTVLAVTRDATEAATSLTNRQFTATSAATNYTTVAGDRIVIEIGMAGDPNNGSDHDSDMRLGDAAGSDLAEDDTSTADNNPWVQLNDTLSFALELPSISATQIFAPSVFQALSLPVITSGSRFAPTVTTVYAITGVFIASGSVLSPPSLSSVQSISLPVIVSTAGLFTPEVAQPPTGSSTSAGNPILQEGSSTDQIQIEDLSGVILAEGSTTQTIAVIQYLGRSITLPTLCRKWQVTPQPARTVTATLTGRIEVVTFPRVDIHIAGEFPLWESATVRAQLHNWWQHALKQRPWAISLDDTRMVATNVTTYVAAGTSTITLIDTDGIITGGVYRLMHGPNYEHVIVKEIVSGSTVQLLTPTQFQYGIGATFRDQNYFIGAIRAEQARCPIVDVEASERAPLPQTRFRLVVDFMEDIFNQSV